MSLFFPKGQVPDPFPKGSEKSLFEIFHGLVDILAETYLAPASTRTRLYHSLKFRHIPTSSDYYKNSFYPKTVCLWSSLPAAVAEFPGLVSFKRELSKVSF